MECGGDGRRLPLPTVDFEILYKLQRLTLDTSLESARTTSIVLPYLRPVL